MKMMLCENRNLYDLCRRYVYYYKAYNEFKKLNQIYWSKSMKYAYDDLKEKLGEVENQIIILILDTLIPDDAYVEISCNPNFETYRGFESIIGFGKPASIQTVSIHSPSFYEFVEKLLIEKNRKF